MHTMIISPETMLQTAVVTSDNSNDDGKLTWNSSRSLLEDKTSNNNLLALEQLTFVVDHEDETSVSYDDDENDDDDSITSSNDNSSSSITYTDRLTRSILKSHTKSEPRYIKRHKRSWKSLPSPDMDRIMGELSESCSEEETCSLTTSLSSSDISSMSKRVSFDSVKIRSYQQTMGDNPSVSYGPPISLDWDFEEHDLQDIDVYEATKGLSRRSLRQMALSYIKRKNFLAREYGFTEEELVQAKNDADKAKFLRGVTNTLLPMMHVETALESAGRKAKRIFKSSQ